MHWIFLLTKWNGETSSAPGRLTFPWGQLSDGENKTPGMRQRMWKLLLLKEGQLPNATREVRGCSIMLGSMLRAIGWNVLFCWFCLPSAGRKTKYIHLIHTQPEAQLLHRASLWDWSDLESFHVNLWIFLTVGESSCHAISSACFTPKASSIVSHFNRSQELRKVLAPPTFEAWQNAKLAKLWLVDGNS